MQVLKLKPWRDGHDETVDSVSGVEAELSSEQPGMVRIRFRVRGAIDALRIPGALATERRDGLWQHTCFEVFVMQGDGSYCEFNFSPSTQWAAYRFDGYRRAMSELPVRSTPRIETVIASDMIFLEATVGLQPLVTTDNAPRCRVAIAAVIENLEGRLDYWALAHPAEKPDFHHEDGFIAGLPDNGG